MAQAQPNLPPDVNTFGLTMRKSTGFPMLIVSLSSPKNTYDALFLANYANINIIDALYRVPGVGEVRIFGAGDYAMRIWVKPDRLAKLGLTVPDLVRAVQQQSTVNPSGQIGAQPAPPGQEMTYTVRAQGRLQTRGGVRRDRRALEPGRLGRAAEGRRAHRARRAQLPADRPRQRPAGLRDRHLPDAGLERARRRRRRQARRWRTCSQRFPPDLAVPLLARHDAAGVRGHPRDPDHARRGDGARHLRRLPVPAELARDADPDDRRAGLADRHVRGLSAARLLDQHAVAVRPRARHRPRRRRCDRRRRGGGAPHRGGHDAARRDAEGDGGGVGPGRQHRADSRVGVHPGRLHERHSGAAEQAVRDHDRDLGADLGVQRADAVAGAVGDAAEAAHSRRRACSAASSASSTAGSRRRRTATSA